MDSGGPVTKEVRAPYGDFDGVVKRLASESTPWWPTPPAPPQGAPNVVIVLCDDLGFADAGCYGSEIATPVLDGLAAAGVRYTNFHATPLCSPTRASLLTGLNPHAAGVGAVGTVGGFPGYRSSLADDVVSAAELFRSNGYATMMVGKWHLNPAEDLGEAGDRSSWPLQRGFDQYYGFSDSMGFTNLHHPHRLQRDNQVVETDAYPPGYYFTDDITDEAIRMVRGVKTSDPNKPFFLYFAHAAVHGPLQAKETDIAKYRGAYDEGWDVIRQRRYERQLELGVIAPGTELAPRNSEPWYAVKPWDDLPQREQQFLARHMEVYAAMVDNIDQSLGRLRDTLEELGELDNTVIIFMSDNGASREGGEYGSTEYLRTVAMVFAEMENTTLSERDYERADLLGGPRVLGHYPWGWAMAGNTPFRLYKSTAFNGGHQVPFVMSWPTGIPDRGTIRQQYTHVTDVLPTLVDLIGLSVPAERGGLPAQPMTGASFATTLEDPSAAPSRNEQYIEMNGHRAFYRDGWEVVTLHPRQAEFSDSEWQLYNVAEDPTQIHNLAAIHPDRVRELSDGFDAAAWANQVYPLDDAYMAMTGRPGQMVPSAQITLSPANHTLDPNRSRALIQGQAFSFTVDLTAAPTDQGTLVAHGDQGGGYGLYVIDGELTYVHNGFGNYTVVPAGPLPDGRSRITVEVQRSMTGWAVGILVDDQPRTTAEATPAIGMLAPFEGIDVGIDRRSPVWWAAYERFGAFPFSGQIHTVTYGTAERTPAVDASVGYRD